ncbi:MAG: hypothetical protein Q4C49_07515 [Bacillota bacterium]|nr:hypothetical protein [Bacillota bacterium]
MEKIKILKAQCGVTEGGMACGPVGGNVVATVTYEVDGEVSYLSEVEVQGIPNFYLTEDDIFDKLLEEDMDDEEFTEYLDDNYLDGFAGFELDIDYDFVNNLRDEETGYGKLLLYIIYIVRSELDEMSQFITDSIGKTIDEIDIPLLDVESLEEIW